MSNTTLAAEGPRQPPTAVIRELGFIHFLHPGYDRSAGQLLSLPRVDSCPAPDPTLVDSGPGVGVSPRRPRLGVCHRTALLACQIIANNAFGGYLALDKEGKQRVHVESIEVLTDEEYFFFVVKDSGMHRFSLTHGP